MVSKYTIIGAGPAGLAAGYYAKQNGDNFTIYEANETVGGNCRTIEHNGFRFDTGAHRFHDKDGEATQLVKSLLGDELLSVKAPSSIYFKGKKVDFPLSPLNVLSTLSVPDIFKAGYDYLAARFSSNNDDSFEATAIANYGKTIANYFLLNYSEKLWGVSCSNLLSETSGNRLNGLNINTFLKEIFKGKNAKTEHLDGAFYYPKNGYGSITNALANACGSANIKLGEKVTRIFHSEGRISSLEINEETKVEVDKVLSSMPISTLLSVMQPQPPEEVLQAANSLRFRNLVLLVFLLDKPGISEDATTYYPEAKYPFTRIYEPRNRSALMAPEGKTSLVVEVPCWHDDDVWTGDGQQVIKSIQSHLLELRLFTSEQVIQAFQMKLPNAYPVLQKGVEDNLEVINNYLAGFNNLTMLGRNGLFAYTHLHDMIRNGRQVILGNSNS